MKAATDERHRFDRWAVVVTAILLAALITRLGFLSLRPLHHDEGVNYWFAQRIIDTGTYTYDPTNYHGPTFFFVLFLSFLLLGISEFSLRFPAAVFGIALVCTPLVLSRRAGGWALPAAWLMLLSPSLTYFSRYAIHESLLVWLSLAAVLLLFVVIDRQDLRYLPLFGAAVALLLATKETAVIVLAALLLIGLVHVRRLTSAFRRPGSREVILLSIAIFALLYSTFFTSFFTNPHGLVDSFQGLTPWISRGVEGAGHNKPWWYYLGLLFRFELPLLLLGAIGLGVAWRSLLGRCIALWAVVIFFTYSWLDYKTPWLLINVTVPLAALAAVGYRGIKSRVSQRIGIAAGAVFLLLFTVHFNFIQTWQSGNPYAYEHTDVDTLNLVSAVNALGKPRAKVNVLSSEYWPLPFYLRHHDAGFPGSAEADSFSDFGAYDAVILPDRPFDSMSLPAGYGIRRYRLRNGVTLLLVSRQP